MVAFMTAYGKGPRRPSVRQKSFADPDARTMIVAMIDALQHDTGEAPQECSPTTDT
jgi:hypothetical protein